MLDFLNALKKSNIRLKKVKLFKNGLRDKLFSMLF